MAEKLYGPANLFELATDANRALEKQVELFRKSPVSLAQHASFLLTAIRTDPTSAAIILAAAVQRIVDLEEKVSALTAAN